MDKVTRNTDGRERMLYLMSWCILLDIQRREVMRYTEGRKGDAVPGVSCWISSGGGDEEHRGKEGILYPVYPAGYPVEGKGCWTWCILLDIQGRGREGVLYLVYPAGYPVEGGDEEHRGKGGDAVPGVSCWISSGGR